MSILNDNWRVGGTDLTEFLRRTKELENRTKVLDLKCKNLILYTLLGETPSEWKFKVNFSDSTGEGTLPKRYFATEGEEIFNELAKSIGEERGAIGYKDGAINHLFPYSSWFVVSLCAKLGVKGCPLYTPTEKRDAFLASIFDSTKAQLVLREEGKQKKVFTVRGKDYAPIPQNQTFSDVINFLEGEFNKVKSEQWTIGNDFSEIILALPDAEEELKDLYPEIAGELTPKIWMSTSDIGLSSFCVFAGFKARGTFLSPIKFRVYAEHTKSFNKDKLLKKLKEKVFAEYASYPKVFSELLLVDVKVGEAVDEILAHCKVCKPGLQKATKAIAALVKNDLGGENATTSAYEVVMAVVSAPKRIVDNGGNSLPKSTIGLLEDAFASAPFTKFNKKYALLPE